MTLLNSPSQFDYLDAYFADNTSMFRQAEWLISDFSAPVWEYQLGTKSVCTVDWNVTLDDGESLLHPKHNDLLEGLKQYLISSTKNAKDMLSETNSITCQQSNFYYTGHIIDYILINSKNYQLATFGLEGLGKNQLIDILEKTGKSKDADDIFDWEVSVGKLSTSIIESVPKQLLEDVLDEHPAMRLVSPEQEDKNNLGIPASEIPYARAALYTQGLLRKVHNHWRVNVPQLTAIIYPNTLFAKSGVRRLIPTLSFDTQHHNHGREFPAVRIHTGPQGKVLSHRFINYQTTLYRMGCLHESGVPAPHIDDLEGLMSHEAEVSTGGRFRTLPSTIVLGAVNKAIEYHFKHGEHLISSFCRLALHCVKAGKPPIAFKGQNLLTILRPETTKLGVTSVSLRSRTAIRHSREDYYLKLRNNTSLCELVRVYIGSVQVVVGALMARRSGELIDLKTMTCLDSTEQWLLFLNRKSTTATFGIRNIQARPIEPVAVEMIKNLIRMQKILKRIGYIKEMTSLFSVPCPQGSRKFSKCTKDIFATNFDFFCDYFETAKNEAGERYYIRQHQLRRFFAMLFYHSSSFGGLETLQWMLAHTNRRHVWNYITESLTGAELMSSKSQHVAEQLHYGGTESYENLRKLLKKRYGTDDFLLWDMDELEDEITQLQKEGIVEIEPDFFEDENGEQMQIVVKIVEPAA
ncbi:hypothetical protein IAE37_001272 [Pseudomonas sp. S31]|uniref:integrase n=1 Tax=Pseudomonas sp. S31 TaxID=1564473 RepID=UPI00191348EA|nr:integrase [Pseudomonas sp. S31]MBK4998996.1 hypothetical protein [Pseudomonas sp. S31]